MANIKTVFNTFCKQVGITSKYDPRYSYYKKICKKEWDLNGGCAGGGPGTGTKTNPEAGREYLDMLHL